MEKNIICFLFLLGSFSGSAQSLELSANYSLYYNHTYGIQVKWMKPILEKDKMKWEWGLNPSIHYAATADTDEQFENFSGRHIHYHLSTVFGPQFRLFKKQKWSFAMHGMLSYAVLRTESSLEHELYDISRSYKNTYDILTGGIQTSIGYQLSPQSEVIVHFTSLFTDLPNFVGIGLRKNLKSAR